LKRGVSNTFSMSDLEPSPQQSENEDIMQGSPSWSVPNDVFAFGLAIYNSRQWYKSEKLLVLPPERPPFLDEQEWDLVRRMCARIPENRVSMGYVVHQLQAFVNYPKPKEIGLPIARSAEAGDDVSEVATEQPCSPPGDFNEYEIRVKAGEAMAELEEMCAYMGESDPFLAGVWKRLSTLYSQLQTPDRIKNSTKVMEAFGNVVDPFFIQLRRRKGDSWWGSFESEGSFSDILNDSYGSEVASFCAARIASQNAAVIHQDIDHLLMMAGLQDTLTSAKAPPSYEMLADIRGDSTDSSNFDPGTPDNDDWHQEWSKLRHEQLRAFQSCLLNTEALKDQLRDPKARLEAQILLHFELHKRRSSYPNSVLDAMTQAVEVLESICYRAEALPSWFIPRYEVVMDRRRVIYSDAWGEAYYGKWFGKEVAVFIKYPEPEALKATSGDSSDEDVVQRFWRVANRWFKLNHQNVVQLCGACHVGTPFIVFELTKGELPRLKGLASAKSVHNLDENGSERSDIMRCLFQMGMGLKGLHERGIIHSDVVVNRFRVAIDGRTIKLGSLEWSSGNADHLTGAVRWKAPEYLEGAPATVMSDVYSLGMCFLEILSGTYPWEQVPDAVVQYRVTRSKALPARPKNLSDLQWSLIQRMCCFNPSERISIDAVVDMLHTFRFEN
jgi:hypothetical protein